MVLGLNLGEYVAAVFLKTPSTFGVRGFSFILVPSSMGRIIHILIVVFVLIIFKDGSAQRDSVSLLRIHNGDTTQIADTLDGFHLRYLPFYYEDLGNNGSKRFSLLAKQSDFILFGSVSFLNEQNYNNYRSAIAVTSASYILGTNKSQELKLLHVQPLGKQVHFWIDYQRNRAEGFFLYQLNDQDILNFGVSYLGKRKKYFAPISARLHDLDRQENGGLLDSVYRAENFGNPRLYPVRMRDGITNLRNRELGLEHGVFIGKGFSVHHVINVSDKEFIYSGNPLNGYYGNIFFDSLQTNDKTFASQLKNNGFLQWKRQKINVKIGAGHYLNNYRSNGISLNNHSFSTIINFNYFDSTHVVNANAEYFLTGYHAEDFRSEIKYKFLKKGEKFISSELCAMQNSPALNTTYTNSNHYFFSGIFLPVVSVSADVNIHFWKDKLAIGSFFVHTTNGMYFRESEFIQDSSSAIAYGGKVSFASNIGKHWRFKAEGIVQQTENENVFRIPGFIGWGSIFYSGTAWSMRFNTGVSTRYYSGFYGNAFVPALNIYQLQNTQLTGNYPLIDAFFEAEISTVRIFISVDHILDGVLGKEFFTAPGYLMPLRTIRFGLRWKFIN